MNGISLILFLICYLEFKVVLSQIYSYEHFLEKNAPTSRFENMKNPPTGWVFTKYIPESIEWFIEDQAFSPLSYDLAPPPPPLPSESSTGDTQEDWERETTADGRGGGVVGTEPNHAAERKPGPL